MAIPNLLDRLELILRETTRPEDRLTLETAMTLCRHTLNPESPPSWPLNLDEWELWEGSNLPEGTGWWLLHTAEKLRCVRRRKPRQEQLTLDDSR